MRWVVLILIAAPCAAAFGADCAGMHALTQQWCEGDLECLEAAQRDHNTCARPPGCQSANDGRSNGTMARHGAVLLRGKEGDKDGYRYQERDACSSNCGQCPGSRGCCCWSDCCNGCCNDGCCLSGDCIGPNICKCSCTAGDVPKHVIQHGSVAFSLAPDYSGRRAMCYDFSTRTIYASSGTCYSEPKGGCLRWGCADLCSPFCSCGIIQQQNIPNDAKCLDAAADALFAAFLAIATDARTLPIGR